MNLENLPDLKSKNLTQVLSIPVDPGMKKRVAELKTKHRKDTNEWLRQIIRRELEKLEG